MSFKVIALLIVCALAAMFAIAEAAPSDVCSLPHKSGECLAYFQRWAYDSESKSCVQFVYGGCRGNANNFVTEEECLKACA